jgi:Putative MetA-pathway of phenol degradation
LQGCNPNFINVDLTATKKFDKWEFGAVAYGSADLTRPVVNYQKQSEIAVGGLLGYDFGFGHCTGLRHDGSNGAQLHGRPGHARLAPLGHSALDAGIRSKEADVAGSMVASAKPFWRARSALRIPDFGETICGFASWL